jgi:hypothetical protein
MIRLTYDPELVEEAVLLAEATAPRAFRQDRNRIYEIADPDEREARFRSCHRRWFVRLGLNRIIEQTVSERPDIAKRLAAGRVVRAVARRDEAADLIDQVTPGVQDPRPILLLRLRPASLIEADALADLLRHELMHVADMLDPRFGYQRTLPSSDSGPSHDNILRDRYRVLWDVTIDGRLARSGLASDRTSAARWQEFASTFAMLGARCRDAFEEWYERRQPTHEALVAFVTEQ